MVKSDEEVLSESVGDFVSSLSHIREELGDEETQLQELTDKLEDNERSESMQRQVSIGRIKIETNSLCNSLNVFSGLLKTYFAKMDRNMGKLMEKLEKVK